LIEIAQSKATVAHPSRDGAGDDIAGDDKEDVYSGKSSGKGEPRVENHDRQDGDGPKPLNVSTHAVA
jgi:hypothetical protein